ncbi:hypothetical protein TNCV_2521331 [Trichonephila clavipes]|nr:hypothetical protein TNCV_2521331 [Trichonephila clavipes]
MPLCRIFMLLFGNLRTCDRVVAHRASTPKTEHLFGISAHAPQRPMVAYTGMGTVSPGPVGIDSKRAPSVPDASTLSITPRRSSSRDV